LVDYRDHPVYPHGDPGDWPALVRHPFTDDLGQVVGGLGELTTGGGADTPEAVYSGIVAALDLDWRADAVGAVVVMGDAPAHDPEPVTGYTLSDVVARTATLSATAAAAVPQA